ncbi:biotin/lipoate A/B protein ligase family protein [Falseniella ignava]|uniref:BPL/LPL catalytic domain-containing protein n=1 Tax=Falseniella ignava CCUG 37419 TaxID=883112 RepID=K1M403_9LACT|nr:lipoate--protein ligase family protein [Falseniella ignava]EKB58997.1 hypothetical protein HMPREF9707_00075 [Falseniella ignava CCUG 37419]
MTQLNDFLATFQWQTLNEANNPDDQDVNSALAYQDALVRYIVQQNQTQHDKPYGVLHFYSTKIDSIYLGAKDTRVERFNQGIAYLKDNDYRIAVRPHGGLCVISDPGICNVSFVVDSDYFALSIDEGYQLMVDLIETLLNPYHLQVESYEIVDSYCPGSYDIVVNGLKLGGIAQRRFKSGVAIAAYLSIEGNQEERSRLVQTFYRISEADPTYPLVNPASMTTLSQLLDQPITVEQFEQMIMTYFESHTEIQPLSYQDSTLDSIYQEMLLKQHQRSSKYQL